LLFSIAKIVVPELLAIAPRVLNVALVAGLLLLMIPYVPWDPVPAIVEMMPLTSTLLILLLAAT
jgi:hypothetical protein